MGFSRQEYLENGRNGLPFPSSQNAVLGCNLKDDRMILVHFQGKDFNITVIQVYDPTTKMPKMLKLSDFMKTYVELTLKKDVLFITGDWNAKVCSEEISGVIGKFGLGVQNETGQKLTEFCQENTLVIANTLFNNRRDDSTHGHH